ncbi:uncharacterized protein FOMMEDRAFT_152751 [Fomitiporia mediterranea MF3/22]|uniref:uncharacterized protein n=1 Tax=Fomitiporia mediterranea (strain MF3/22) TaxID=694068 RepID=UPI000440865C|nr:uncharacterized protein FOMMEDRAFT_152751 [Fomitiporia mediterranea MF3/22]EJD05442.1 hypothetical protein FOMMEDRAFT_152751 [Fomitiporia mediterranea MF3/22]
MTKFCIGKPLAPFWKIMSLMPIPPTKTRSIFFSNGSDKGSQTRHSEREARTHVSALDHFRFKLTAFPIADMPLSFAHLNGETNCFAASKLQSLGDASLLILLLLNTSTRDISFIELDNNPSTSVYFRLAAPKKTSDKSHGTNEKAQLGQIVTTIISVCKDCGYSSEKLDDFNRRLQKVDLEGMRELNREAVEHYADVLKVHSVAKEKELGKDDEMVRKLKQNSKIVNGWRGKNIYPEHKGSDKADEDDLLD